MLEKFEEFLLKKVELVDEKFCPYDKTTGGYENRNGRICYYKEHCSYPTKLDCYICRLRINE